jgi:hypothetical protein
MDRISTLGECELQENTASLHLVHGRAFLGIHPRRGGILINIVLARQLESPQGAPRRSRIRQPVAQRDHPGRPQEIDAELFTWIREGHTFTA